MILDLVRHDDPIISSGVSDFDFGGDVDPIELARNLGETLAAHRAVGLAAPQVGLPYRVIAVGSNPIGVLFNPRIVSASDETSTLEEACLTYPGLVVRVKRARLIRVRYALPNGVVETKQFSDFTARVIQHEIDHLDGKTIAKQDFMSKKRWDKLLKRNGGEPTKLEKKTMSQILDSAETQMTLEDTVRQKNKQLAR